MLALRLRRTMSEALANPIPIDCCRRAKKGRLWNETLRTGICEPGVDCEIIHSSSVISAGNVGE